jgi:phosphopantothenoylcysteine decarboxylase/phosphopantothenate--cysteine ligase
MIAPAMNHRMWAHPATQENAHRLMARGVRLIGPAIGEQACGEQGEGRMVEPIVIADALLAPKPEPEPEPEPKLEPKPEPKSAGAGLPKGDIGPRDEGHPLAGRRVLMTVGPTREAIDPVRFLGNRSSGKMGFALAEALHACGARVSLVAGPTSVPAPSGIERVDVETALEMEAAVMARVADCELFVATAAVADYRPTMVASSKLKKLTDELTLQLVRNPDILARVAALPTPPFTVGFAAETDDPEGYAKGKLEAKHLSMIAANRVGSGAGGFETDENALICLWPGGGRRELPMMSKAALATALADLIAERYAAQTAG